jgi:predicted amidohydrolase YtcJ
VRRLIVADSIRTPAGSFGNALLIEDGRVIEAGDASRLGGDATIEHRFQGGVLVPGFRDAHIHPLAYASAGISLEDATSIEQLRSIIGEVPSDGTIIGTGLDETRLDEGRLPTRHDLDVFDRPVLLHRVCGHIAVANTAALSMAGIGPDAADPPGGAFDRDQDGTPNGIVKETAIAAVVSRLPILPTTSEELLAALHRLARFGITTIGAVVMSSWSEHVESLVEVADDLPLRVHVLVESPSPRDISTASRMLDRPLLTFAGVKEFADGSLGGRTAALRRPYTDDAPNSGMLRLDTVETTPRARAALDHDGIVAVHAIGDLAVARVLDLFEGLIADGASPRSLRIEHASVTTDEDLRRMADLGVTACIQPSFLPSDAHWLPARLGTERASQSYRFASMRSFDIPLCGGSDAPVESPDPLLGIAAARDRAGFHPEEALAAEQALALFTTDGAALLGETTPLAPGSPADFVILNRDPVHSSAQELRGTRVLATWVGGREVHSAHS